MGLLLGVIASAVLLLADHPLGAGPLTASGLAVGSLALLTRGLHLDGLADLADGLASGKPAPAALDIMRRSDIGPLGAVTPGPDAAAPGRRAQPGRIGRPRPGTGRAHRRRGHRQARPDLGLPPGRARGAAGRARRPGRRIGPPGGAGRRHRGHAGGRGRGGRDLGDGAGGPLGWTLPLAVAAGLGAAFAVQRHAVRRLGGITGDVLGALAEIATTVTLVVAAMGPPA